MKRLLLPLLAVFFSLLTIGAVNNRDMNPVRKIKANPINVAVILTEQPDSTSMASTCEYYGYILQSHQDGYTVFQHPNGSSIRFSMKEADSGKKYSTIEVRAKATQKEKGQALRSLNFQKSGNAYIRRSVGYTTQCTNGPRGTLIFQQQPKPKN